MFRYTTKKQYQYIHWMDGRCWQTNVLVSNICQILGVSLTKSKTKEVPSVIAKMRKRAFSESIKNCAMFISGSNGLFRDEELVKSLGEAIERSGSVCFIVRDSMDDPEFFKEIRDFGGIVFVPDYTVVTVRTRTGDKNVLCVGGNVTIDRSWRIKRLNDGRKMLSKKMAYFKDEAPRFDENAIDEIIKDDKLKLDMIVSIIPISYVGEDPYCTDSKWFDVDETLKDDIVNSRGIMDRVMKTLRSANKAPAIWQFSDPSGAEVSESVMGVKFMSRNSNREYRNLVDLFDSIRMRGQTKGYHTTSYIQQMINEESQMGRSHLGIGHGDAVGRGMPQRHNMGVFNLQHDFYGPEEHEELDPTPEAQEPEELLEIEAPDVPNDGVVVNGTVADADDLPMWYDMPNYFTNPMDGITHITQEVTLQAAPAPTDAGVYNTAITSDDIMESVRRYMDTVSVNFATTNTDAAQ